MGLKEYLDGLPYGGKKIFADKIGVSKSFLSQLINGKNVPLKTAKKIVIETEERVTLKDLLPDLRT